MGDYKQHYDRDGKKSGWSEDKGSYDQHYDRDGRKSGWTEDKGSYDQHHDSDGKKSGWTEDKGSYDQHYDSDGNKDGHSEDKSGCFISTACIKSKGLPDNCYELNMLRLFRDQYIKTLPQGEQIIQEYYSIAPRILSKIEDSGNPHKIYNYLYKNLVSKSLKFIKQKRHIKAFHNYLKIVNKLKKRYLEI